MMNRVIVGPLLLEKESDESVAVTFNDAKGQPHTVKISMKDALESAHVFLGWVCGSWLE